jgi:hypothetical protein
MNKTRYNQFSFILTYSYLFHAPKKTIQGKPLKLFLSPYDLHCTISLRLQVKIRVPYSQNRWSKSVLALGL